MSTPDLPPAEGELSWNAPPDSAQAPGLLSSSQLVVLEYDNLEDLPPLPPSSAGSVYEEDAQMQGSPAASDGARNSGGIDDDNYESSDASLETVPTRPNKFLGPASTWRTWTRRERQEVTALETIRARDLSIHLYNAFALKRRARYIAENIRLLKPGEIEGLENDEFAPPKGWTAWPVPPDLVPRRDEHVDGDEDDTWTMKAPPDERTSAELEECLMAQMLKRSKETFTAREWGKKSMRSHSVGLATASETEDKGENTGKEEDDDEDPSMPQDANLRPVVQADDEKGTRILRPTARHILSQLDGLLLGLHRARQSYVPVHYLSVSEGPSETEAEQSSQRQRSQSRPRGLKRTRRLSEEPERADKRIDDPGSDKAEAEDEFHLAKKRARSQGARQARLGLRDWSDVLGIASMTGWPAAAVMRTANRCAALFEEDMLFRTLGEGKVQLEKTAGSGPNWKYTVDDDGLDQPGSPDNNPPMSDFVGARYENILFCPVKGCPRHTKGFSRTWNLNQHLRIMHLQQQSGKSQQMPGDNVDNPR
ncbi:hypothetical protein AJ80_06075 [Polytolypa hystricis UAMH7299]|uniref:Rrn9 domain-containing protein n=1 Tax=Polytolypa hystricis (strain UAMH7299) TaxID=1447883 RepID=A0A2B7XZ65_POLH7|nr:hypothetical protein AJ80_06075 [Polytolypa hystricis UAMH7299]